MEKIQLHNSDKSKAAAIKRRQMEQRRIMCILIVAVLAIFSLGALFGGLLVSAFANDVNVETSASAAEPVIGQNNEGAVLTLCIESDGNILDDELQQAMFEMSEKYEIPVALLLAVAEKESHFNPEAVSTTNDYGMMQINTVNFDRLRKEGIEPLDYKGNIEAGALLLSEAIAKHGEIELALMAYNCGDTGAKRLWEQGIYSTNYSNAIMENYYKWTDYIGGV